MNGLLSLIFFLSFFCLIFGLIKPNIFSFIKNDISRKNIGVIFGFLMFFSVLFVDASVPTVEESINNGLSVSSSISSNVEYESTAKKDDLISEIMESDNVVSTTVSNFLNTQSDKNEIADPSNIQQINILPSVSETYYSVTQVVDGDTIKIRFNDNIESVRLIGINTPETVDPRKSVECYGKEASAYTYNLLNNKQVRIEFDPTQGERDKYGRLLLFIFLQDGTFVNKKIISDGYAYEYTYDKPYKYQNEFKEVEKNAQNNKYGLWADDACIVEQESLDNTSVENYVSADSVGTNGHTWYVSSHHSSRFYYCDTSSVWEGLSKKYLRSYSSEDELKKDFPNHTLHEPCK